MNPGPAANRGEGEAREEGERRKGKEGRRSEERAGRRMRGRKGSSSSVGGSEATGGSSGLCTDPGHGVDGVGGAGLLTHVLRAHTLAADQSWSPRSLPQALTRDGPTGNRAGPKGHNPLLHCHREII